MTSRTTAARRLLATACAATLALGLAAGSAGAETKKKEDPQQRFSQGPALDLEWASFTYAPDVLVFRLKIEQLSKRRTQAIARYTTVDDRYDVLLKAWYDKDGQRRVVGRWSDYEAEDHWNRFTRGIDVRWNQRTDVVTFRLTSHLQDEPRVRVAAYTVAKGAMHGPVRGDYITTTLRRG